MYLKQREHKLSKIHLLSNIEFVEEAHDMGLLLPHVVRFVQILLALVVVSENDRSSGLIP